jgi:hypothetical protein
MGILGLVFGFLIVAKLAGWIDTSWIWVLCPLWLIPMGYVFLVAILSGGIFLLHGTWAP